MSKLTIKLNQTNKAQFCEWLNDYIKKIRGINSVDYPFPGGAVFCILYHEIFQVSKTSFSARIKQRPLGGEPPPGVVAINIYDPDENVTYSFWEWDMDNALGLYWLEVEGGLKVTINHEGAKWVIPPLFQLLAAIKADYPSASDDINRYIVEKADWGAFNPPYSLESSTAMAYIIAEQARDEINKKANQITEQEPQEVGAGKPRSIDQENISMDELIEIEHAAEAGNLEAQKRLAEIQSQEWYIELQQKFREIGIIMGNYVDRSFDDHPSKPVYEMMKNLMRSDNPVHRATAGLFGKLSLAEIQDHGAKLLADELLRSAKKLPPTNVGAVGMGEAEKLIDTRELYQISQLSPYNIELLEKTLAGLPMKAGRDINFCKFVKLSDYPFGHIRYNVYDSIDNYIGHIYLEKHGENATTMWFQYYMKHEETFKKIQATWNKYLENDMVLSRIALENSGSNEAGNEKDDAIPQNIFRQNGDVWEVAFNSGKSFIVKHLIGLAYIHYLLKNPNKPIDVKQLQASQSDNTYSISAKEEEITERHITPEEKKFTRDKIFDDEYQVSIKNELKLLHESRIEAEENGDLEEIERIDLEVANIEKILKTGKGLGGKSRSLSKSDDKIRSSVKVAISNAYSHLNKHDPIFVQYLRATISTGFDCEYSPEKRTDVKPRWIL